MDRLKVNIDGKEHTVSMEEEDGKIKVHLEGKTYHVETSLSNQQKDYGLNDSADSGGEGSIKATLPGSIYSIDVKVGDSVKKGQKLVSLVAMKMENQIASPIDGKVSKILVKKDDKVNKGDLLLIIE